MDKAWPFDTSIILSLSASNDQHSIHMLLHVYCYLPVGRQGVARCRSRAEGLAAMLQTDSSQTSILEVDIPGDLPVSVGGFHPFELRF